MTMKRMLALLVCLCLACIGLVAAVPTTGSVSGIGAGTATFNQAGGASDCWFAWGTSTTNQIYRTWNDTACALTYTVTGAPLLSCTTYYVKACDLTGCGSNKAFTTSAATVSNQSTFGDGFKTLMKSGLNITQMVPIIVSPYSGAMTASVVWGLLFLFIFTGMWIRQHDIVVPMLIAFVAGALVWSGTSALGVPPEWADLGMGLMYAAFAGVVFSWFTR